MTTLEWWINETGKTLVVGDIVKDARPEFAAVVRADGERVLVALLGAVNSRVWASPDIPVLRHEDALDPFSPGGTPRDDQIKPLDNRDVYG